MPCFSPIPSVMTEESDGNKRMALKHTRRQAAIETPDGSCVVELACGHCEGCRANRARSWAIRCFHEAQLHTRMTEDGPVSNNSFLTLTYKTAPPELDLRDFQLFMKRLRKRSDNYLRVFYCGEYGEKNSRPHFHALIFGEDWHADSRPAPVSDPRSNLRVSDKVTTAWGHGFAYVGPLNFATASYTAGYAAKKLRKTQYEDSAPGGWIKSEAAAEKYYDDRMSMSPTPGSKAWKAAHSKIDDFGFVPQLEWKPMKQEFIGMSRGGVSSDGKRHSRGLGHDWIAKYWRDVYPHDSVVVNGKEFRPPEYYDRWLSENQPGVYEDVLVTREAYRAHRGLSTPNELSARRANHMAQDSLKKVRRHEDFARIDGNY